MVYELEYTRLHACVAKSCVIIHESSFPLMAKDIILFQFFESLKSHANSVIFAAKSFKQPHPKIETFLMKYNKVAFFELVTFLATLNRHHSNLLSLSINQSLINGCESLEKDDIDLLELVSLISSISKKYTNILLISSYPIDYLKKIVSELTETRIIKSEFEAITPLNFVMHYFTKCCFEIPDFNQFQQFYFDHYTHFPSYGITEDVTNDNSNSNDVQNCFSKCLDSIAFKTKRIRMLNSFVDQIIDLRSGINKITDYYFSFELFRSHDEAQMNIRRIPTDKQKFIYNLQSLDTYTAFINSDETKIKIKERIKQEGRKNFILTLSDKRMKYEKYFLEGTMNSLETLLKIILFPKIIEINKIKAIRQIRNHFPIHAKGKSKLIKDFQSLKIKFNPFQKNYDEIWLKIIEGYLIELKTIKNALEEKMELDTSEKSILN